jgi:hypothetical protein
MQPIELVRILDRIRDEELGLTRLCERFAESMQTALQVREVQLLVHNPDMGTLENPVPGRATRPSGSRTTSWPCRCGHGTRCWAG